MEITIYQEDSAINKEQREINKEIDTQILEWVKNNYWISNFSQELYNFIYNLRHATFNNYAIEYLDYKLKLYDYWMTK